ncbi:PaaI family thioesterase [Roseateles sp. BYS180W]|uniref:PaaI family thioesterase n=1 Tax=Roseateles rivi TaxID=3299028 RepID=A0ABW7FUC3_9BURK
MEPSNKPTVAFHDMPQMGLPKLLGIAFDHVGRGRATATLALRPELMAPNGYLHAGTVVSLADTCAGYGCVASLPDGANSFTTIELKSNFLGTAREGQIQCEATLTHGGRTTQVWDATVRQGDRVLAMFRCTQMLLYPRG